MAEQSFEEAVIVVQEASEKIAEVSKKLAGLDGQNKELLAVLNDLTNKVSILEQKQTSATTAIAPRNVPLYIRVSVILYLVQMQALNSIYFVKSAAFCLQRIVSQ